MQFLYNELSGKSLLQVDGEVYKYLFRVRRFKVGSHIELRNLQDSNLYLYKIKTIDKKEALLELISSEESIVIVKKNLHIGWCIIDPKNVEKSITALNEMGVAKITFIKCAYSQANFKIKKERLEKILINSCQQCGRSSLMHIDFTNSIASFVQANPQSFLLDFSSNSLSENSSNIDTIVVGCEGGLTKEERALFSDNQIVGYDTPLILRSESAVCAAASKILL